MFNPDKGQKALRRGRHSVDGATYFLTICTENRTSGLENASLTAVLIDYAQRAGNPWNLRSMVVMPDHVHLLIELKVSSSLPEAIRLFKGRTSVSLRSQGFKWQRGYFDHCLRATEDVLPVFLYLFLNPHRAGLIPADHCWPGYFCDSEDWIWFESLTASSLPFPEWLESDRGVKPLRHTE